MSAVYRIAVAALLLGACQSPTPPPEVVTGLALEAGDAVAEIRSLPSGKQVWFLLRADEQAPPRPAATLEGVVLDIGSGARVLPFVAATEAADGSIQLRCETRRDHQLEVILKLADHGFDLRLIDEVGIRSQLAEASLLMRFVAGPLDECRVPTLHGSPVAEIATDDGFFSPLAFARSGPLAAAWIPDLAVLADERRLPHAVRIDPEASGARVRYGLIAAKRATRAGREFGLRQPDAPVQVGGETLTAAVRLILEPRAEPLITRQRIQTEAWPFDEDSARRPVVSWSQWSEEQLLPIAGTQWRSWRRADGVQFGFPDLEGESRVRFSQDANAMHVAAALARTAPDREDWTRRATQLVDLVLSRPERAGLFHSVYRRSGGDGDGRWLPSEFDPDQFRSADSAVTGTLLLDLADLLPEHRERIHAQCDRLAQFFVENQRADGTFPMAFDAEYASPIRAELGETPAESAPVARFLAHHAARLSRPESARSALRAVNALAGAFRQNGAFGRARSKSVDGSAAPPVSVESIAHAALAATELNSAAAQSSASTFMAELVTHQQVWTPPWRDNAVRGGFPTSNESFAWTTGATILAARALFAGYAQTGQFELLTRGHAALDALQQAALSSDEAAAAAVLQEDIRSQFGQAIVDMHSRRAVGLDAVWFERATITESRVELGARTNSSIDDLRVTFRNFDETSPVELVVDDRRLGVLPPDDLAQGVAIATRYLPRIDFRPPPHLRAGGTWLPRAKATGAAGVALGARVSIELVDTDERAFQLGEFPMSVRAPGGWLETETPVSLAAAKPGDVLHARLEWGVGPEGSLSRTSLERTLVIAETRCIDPGDDDEYLLGQQSENCRIVRFVNGRENARQATAGAWFEYRLPIEVQAARVEVTMSVAGATRIVGADGQTLHEDRTDAPSTAREIRLELSDPRLWRREVLELRFEPLGDAMELARVEWLTDGLTGRDLESASLERAVATPIPTVDVRVLTLDLADAVGTRNIEDVREAFFGGPEYRLTPRPNERVTIGSAASLVERLSGGVTRLEGDLLQPIRSEVDRSQIGSDAEAARQTLANELAERFRISMIDGQDAPTAFVVVYDGGPSEALDEWPLRIGHDGHRTRSIGIPVVFISEREADGSFLSSGSITLALLDRISRLIDLTPPENGAFGDLALSSATTTTRHRSPTPAGENLLRTGWVGRVDVPQDSTGRTLRVASLLGGRVTYRLPIGLPGRGDLHLEYRDERDAPGSLIYWKFPAGAEPFVQRLDGRSLRPKILRLAPRSALHEAAFQPGDDSQLFRDIVTMTGSSVPTPATMRGDVPWSIERLDHTQSGATLAVRWHGEQLLERPVYWSVADTGIVPLVPDRPTRGVRLTPGLKSYEFAAFPQRPVRLLARTTLPELQTSSTLFGQIDDFAGEPARLRVFIGGRLTLDARLAENRSTLRFEIPMNRSQSGAQVLLAIDTANVMTGRLTSLMTVPRSERSTTVPLPAGELTSVRLANGLDYSRPRILEPRQDDRAVKASPVLVPAGRSVLRLRAGLGESAANPVRLSVRIKRSDGSGSTQVLREHLFSNTDDSNPAVQTLLIELPEQESQQLAFLEWTLDGDEPLWILDAEVEQR